MKKTIDFILVLFDITLVAALFFIFLLISGCTDLGRVRGIGAQEIADNCKREAENNGRADAIEWIPLAGIGLGADIRRQAFKDCVARHGAEWLQ